MARIVLAKLGTDAHEMGIHVVGEWLKEAGHEVTYAGVYNTPERLVSIAEKENADIVGVSYLGGEPVYLSSRVLNLLKEKGMDEVPLVVGGVITPEMRAELEELGVKGVFPPGTRREAIMEGIADVLAKGGRNR
jgi:methylmalonyl-CoA mutase C-terminal domain/subunit